MRTYITLACLGSLVLSCGAAAQLAQVDSAVRSACELLALRQGVVLHLDPKAIIKATCDVEAVTRQMREDLLARQLDAARDAGVPVLPIMSDALDEAPDGGQ